MNLNSSLIKQAILSFLVFTPTFWMPVNAGVIDSHVDPSFTCTMEVHFSPFEDLEFFVNRELSKAQSSVYMSLYGISNPRLVETLLELKKRGVHIEIGMDMLQSAGASSKTQELIDAGIPVYIKPSHVLEHNKFAVIDAKEVITGSWNWSSSANHQDNNDTILYCPQAAKQYMDDFNRIKARDYGHANQLPKLPVGQNSSPINH